MHPILHAPLEMQSSLKHKCRYLTCNLLETILRIYALLFYVCMCVLYIYRTYYPRTANNYFKKLFQAYMDNQDIKNIKYC